MNSIHQAAPIHRTGPWILAGLGLLISASVLIGCPPIVGAECDPIVSTANTHGNSPIDDRENVEVLENQIVEVGDDTMLLAGHVTIHELFRYLQNETGKPLLFRALHNPVAGQSDSKTDLRAVRSSRARIRTGGSTVITIHQDDGLFDPHSRASVYIAEPIQPLSASVVKAILAANSIWVDELVLNDQRSVLMASTDHPDKRRHYLQFLQEEIPPATSYQATREGDLSLEPDPAVEFLTKDLVVVKLSHANPGDVDRICRHLDVRIDRLKNSSAIVAHGKPVVLREILQIIKALDHPRLWVGSPDQTGVSKDEDMLNGGEKAPSEPQEKPKGNSDRSEHTPEDETTAEENALCTL